MSLFTQKIREGMDFTKPLVGMFISRQGETIFACPIGCALVACNLDCDSGFTQRLEAAAQINLNQFVRHPVTSSLLPLQLVIVDLTDSHQWSRESVLEWLEELNV